MVGNAIPSTLGIVIPGTDTQDSSGNEPKVLAKLDPLLLATRVLGCGGDAARARLLKVDPKTIWNLRNGKPISGDVIARTLLIVRQHRDVLGPLGIGAFEDLFEVVGDIDSVEAAA